MEFNTLNIILGFVSIIVLIFFLLYIGKETPPPPVKVSTSVVVLPIPVPVPVPDPVSTPVPMSASPPVIMSQSPIKMDKNMDIMGMDTNFNLLKYDNFD